MRFLRLIPLLLILSAAPSLSAAASPGERELDLVLIRSPNVENGAALYETCAACHGQNGEGVSDGTVPALAGQPYSMLAKQIVDFRAGRRSDPRMVHFTDHTHLAFSQQIADVAAYISRLKPRPSGGEAPRQVLSKDASGRGAMVYVRTCERCHGPVAEGQEEKFIPRLASQHYEYLLKQLEDGAQKLRPALADAHASFSAQLNREQLAAVAAYLATLPP